MSAAPGVTGIVLAGGRSSRFGSDKLVAEIDGRTLLDRSTAALGGIVSEIVVVTAPGAARRPAPTTVPIRLVEDREAFGGPLVGLLAGLEVAAEPLVAVVAGDMPTIVPEVLQALVRTLGTSPAIAATILESRGESVPLPAALRTAAAIDVVHRLVEDGERRLRGVFEQLATRRLEEVEWRRLDPAGFTLRDVDVPADLPPNST